MLSHLFGLCLLPCQAPEQSQNSFQQQSENAFYPLFPLQSIIAREKLLQPSEMKLSSTIPHTEKCGQGSVSVLSKTKNIRTKLTLHSAGNLCRRI